MPELETLYYDKYNYETGQFDGISEKMKKIYKKDVEEFWKTFTGETDVPEYVKKFSDIKLKDYYNIAGCREKNNFDDEDALSPPHDEQPQPPERTSTQITDEDAFYHLLTMNNPNPRNEQAPR